MQLYFVSQNKGNYGKTIETAQGIAKRGRTSKKAYFSIFGKMKVTRYLYHMAKSKDWDEYWEFFTARAKNNTFFPDECTGKNGCLILATLK